MKTLVSILVMLVFAWLVPHADAWGFRSRTRTTTVTRSVNVYSSPQAAVADKAARMAAACRMAHLGSGYGGANAEGVGCATTAQGALNSCCFTGKRKLAAQAVVRGRNGMYYACKVFW